MSSLQNRLSKQLAARGVKNSKGVATGLLRKRGQMDASGHLNSEGKKRQKLGAAGRAKSRAAKAAGRKPNDYKYNKKTNRATVK